MNTMSDSREIRQRAWNALKGSYWSFIGALFVQMLASFGLIVVPIIAGIAASYLCGVNDDTIKDLLFAIEYCHFEEVNMTFLAILASAFLAILLVASYVAGFVRWGCATMSLATVRGKMTFGLWDSGYGHGWHMLWLLSVKGFYLFFWSLLFIVPGIIKTFSYALTPFIAVDHPDWSANRCITESRKLMDGAKWRFFCLVMSFIGWYVLVWLAACRGFQFVKIFLQPYLETSFAAFYEERKSICQNEVLA